MCYEIRFDFDTEGDPPHVVIVDTESGFDVLEVFEEPTCLDASGWSWDGDDWEPGPLATRVLQLLI